MPTKALPKVQLNITKKLIDEAIKGDSSHCMIAEAVKIAYPSASHVHVDIQTIRFTDPERRERYFFLTPRRAQMEILAFDHGDPVRPFRTTIKDPMVQPSGTGEKKAQMVKSTVSGKRSTPKIVLGKDSPPRAPLGGTTGSVKKAAAKKVAKRQQRRRGKATGSIGNRRVYGLRSMT